MLDLPRLGAVGTERMLGSCVMVPCGTAEPLLDAAMGAPHRRVGGGGTPCLWASAMRTSMHLFSDVVAPPATVGVQGPVPPPVGVADGTALAVELVGLALAGV